MPPDDRYARQTILPEIGPDGQARLGEAHAVVVGCGALGAMQAQLLARAGVGRLTLIDRDLVERSNLQRQLLFTDDDAEASRPKAVAAEAALRLINPTIRVDGMVEDLRAVNAATLLAGATLLCDGSDSFETRYLINDYAVREQIPWVYGGVIGTGGLVLPILPGETACLRCVFETPPAAGDLPTCETAGVLGPAAAIIGALQATESLKILTGARDAVRRGLLRVELWMAEYQALAIGEPRSDCPTCGAHDYAWLEGRAGARAARLCGREAIQLLPHDARPPALDVIAARLTPEWTVVHNPHYLRARREGMTVTLFRDGRMIVDGTTDEAEARSVGARVIGV
ncbi:MAG: ThiF family adenylyltransferase [Gemmatimonadota bacterium]